MDRPSWDSFNIKNKDKTRAFEDMCRVLFLRKLKKSSYDYSYNFNQAGLEFEPVYDEDNKKWCGAQCKYFTSESSSTKYKQIYDSLKTASKYYKGRLDTVIIYTNAQLQPNCTEKELQSTKNSNRINIIKEAKKNDIKLIWMQADNIIDTIIEASNIDLQNLYFSDTREIDFCKSSISISDRTFLLSNECFDIHLNNNISFNMLHKEVIKEKINLVLGAAGTGKTMIMKKLYLGFSLLFSNNYFQKKSSEDMVYIPIMIKLKECINGDLETLVREHLKDYNMNYTHNAYQYVYLLDGLDEVSYYDLNKVCNFINNTATSNQVKSIIISSRTDSNNLSYLNQEMTCTVFTINKLKRGDINKYFAIRDNKAKQSMLKKLQNNDLLDDIDDIFSVHLLWNYIDQVNNNTSKIEIIELSIKYWIKHYSKYLSLPLLEPKEKYLMDICKTVAYNMQEHMILAMPLEDIQKIIISKTSRNSPNEINEIVDALTDLFFERSNYENLVSLLSFRHRRYQEYFLYLVVEEQFYSRPNILRELNLLPNRDFIVKVFLRTSLKKYETSKDIFKCLALRLFECYLGADFFKNYTDDIVGKKYSFGINEFSYKYSESFMYLLSTFKRKDLEILFENPNLCISDAINHENFARFIEIYYRRNQNYIGDLDKITSNITGEIKCDSYRGLYYLYNVEKKSINELYIKYCKDSVISEEEVSHSDYLDHEDSVVYAFIKLCLEFVHPPFLLVLNIR